MQRPIPSPASSRYPLQLIDLTTTSSVGRSPSMEAFELTPVPVVKRDPSKSVPRSEPL